MVLTLSGAELERLTGLTTSDITQLKDAISETVLGRPAVTCTYVGAIPMVTMSQSELVQQAHSHGSHTFTHTLYIATVTTTWCEAPDQLLFFSACWVFLCFRIPSNSDMYYKIFNGLQDL